eukprot:sb/3479294/
MRVGTTPLGVLEVDASLGAVGLVQSDPNLPGNPFPPSMIPVNRGPTVLSIHSTVKSDPDLVPPDLVTPRFSDRINFPRYRNLTVFDPDLVPTPI